jgi:hypothetical protein
MTLKTQNLLRLICISTLLPNFLLAFTDEDRACTYDVIVIGYVMTYGIHCLAAVVKGGTLQGTLTNFVPPWEQVGVH